MSTFPSSSTPLVNLPPRTDIITYRYNNELVYVKPEPLYEVRTFLASCCLVLILLHDAVSLAIGEFPALSNISRERVVLITMATMAGARQRVRISASAWESATRRLVRGEVVEVHLLPDASEGKKAGIVHEDYVAPPPQYLEVPDFRMTASRPVSRAGSPVPSNRSHKSLSFFEKLMGGSET